MLLWDTSDPYRYYRIESHRDFDLRDLRRRGSQDRTRTGHRKRFARLEAGLRTLAPDVEITHRWSGQVIETHDGLPLSVSRPLINSQERVIQATASRSGRSRE